MKQQQWYENIVGRILHLKENTIPNLMYKVNYICRVCKAISEDYLSNFGLGNISIKLMSGHFVPQPGARRILKQVPEAVCDTVAE